MNTYRRTAVIVGVLYIIGTASGILSLAATSSVLVEPPTFLEVFSQISANQSQLILGALLILLMGLSLAMIPVVMYPILKRQNETLALGYVVVRGALEAFTYLMITVSWLLLVTFSHEFIAAGAASDSQFEILGIVLAESHHWITHLTEIIFPIGALMFYYLLYQMHLVPRWISVWGLIAAIPYFVSGFLAIFGIIEATSTAQAIMVMPLALQEMIMALWLIFRGFNSSALSAKFA
ncbi:MAG: hypothetical protein CL607_28700 [Anaerolineaceae bacterium]|nr:hypothetical protein [Anaerolineaceae bacterium]